MNDLEQRVAALEAILGRGNFLTSTVQQKDATFNGRMKLVNRTALPSTCAVGELAMLNGVQYVCSAADTWTASGGSGSPGGSDTQVQFNDGGSAFGGDADFTWNKTSNILSLGAVNNIATIKAPDAGAGDKGTNLIINAGDGTDDNGGYIHILGGTGGTTDGNGGDVFLEGGDAPAGYDGGEVLLVSGSGGTSGVFLLRAGLSIDSGIRNGDIELQLESNDEISGRFIRSATGNVFAYQQLANIATTNATPATIGIVIPNADSSVVIEMHASARRSGGSAGTDGDSAGYVRRAVYTRIGSAAPTLVGSIQDGFTVESQAGWDATFAVSSNTIQAQVTGATNNNVNWILDIRYIPASSSFIS